MGGAFRAVLQPKRAKASHDGAPCRHDAQSPLQKIALLRQNRANCEVIEVSVPVVPISEFKANPAKFMTSGAVVTNHGKPQARLVPIVSADSRRISGVVDAAKVALTVLYGIQPAEDVAAELNELSASRDARIVGEPQ
ncbi:type II toxin-antitoxin system Phd/YefM family antitoxin [Microbacterium sp. A588]